LSVAIPFLWAGLHFYVAAPEDGRTPALSLIPLSSQYMQRVMGKSQDKRLEMFATRVQHSTTWKEESSPAPPKGSISLSDQNYSI
jgi:hypothetical protein